MSTNHLYHLYHDYITIYHLFLSIFWGFFPQVDELTEKDPLRMVPLWFQSAGLWSQLSRSRIPSVARSVQKIDGCEQKLNFLGWLHQRRFITFNILQLMGFNGGLMVV